jgi:hypothetical protein
VPADNPTFLDRLFGRTALKKAADPLAATAQPLPTQSSTAQTDLAKAIAANPNNQPQPTDPAKKPAVSPNRWPKTGSTSGQ